MRAHQVFFQVFNVTVTLCCGKKEDVYILLNEEDYDFFISDWNDNREGLCCSFGNHEVLIWLKRVPRSINDKSILVHELSHAVTEILKYVDTRYDESTKELYAYLLGYLYKEFNTAFRRSNSSTRKNVVPSEQDVTE